MERQAAGLTASEVVRATLDASPTITLVLNSYRQVVYYNRALLDILDVDDPCQVLARRPGEVVNCVHAGEVEQGCGASESCQFCGALASIMDALMGRPNTRECRITRQIANRTEPLDMAVHSYPITVGGERFAAVSLVDISHEKRRRALERIFFHDVLNTAACVQGLADAVNSLAKDTPALRTAALLQAAARQLVHEITHQRTLAAAEINEITVEVEPVSTLDLLTAEVDRYSGFQVARDRVLTVAANAADARILTDRSLLARVLGNMLSNALEACEPAGTVRAGCRDLGAHVEFWVHNGGAMPREVQAQVFQRSFSTKGSGRGLGAYSMKLLTERYLSGRISFTSSEQEGTVFRARYPRMLAR